MALDATAQKTNFYYSLKKYIIDNFYIPGQCEIVFDRFLPPDATIEQWLAIIQNPLQRDTLSTYVVDLYCVTRKDYEGDKLTVLLDKVAEYFDGDTTQTDGLKRIPFYDSVSGTQIGAMVVTETKEGDTLDAPDQSKFVIVTITFRMASKI